MISQDGTRTGDFVPKSVSILRKGYSASDFLHDAAAGLTVALVALPLAMAFAIASHVPPERGLYTAIVAGFVISLFSGSRHQIGGPTGAFVVIIADIVDVHGYEGLVAATLIAGGLLFLMGAAQLGRYIKFIPYPVTTGFTTGIGVLIFSSQVKDLLGLPMAQVPADFIEKWSAYFHAGPPDTMTLGIGLSTLAVMLLVRRFSPRIPAPLAGVLFASLATTIFAVPVETIGSRFGGVPQELPPFTLHFPTMDMIRRVFPEALTITLLAGIESLLSAVVADGMTGERHNSNTELMGLGIANFFSVCLGGIPATGAVARTATNIKCGAHSPVSGMLHAALLLAFLLFLAPLTDNIPLCSLAAVLTLVAFDMSEIRKFKRLLSAPASDMLVMLLTFVITMVVDLVLAVQVGVVLASLLFMKRMSDITNITRPQWLTDNSPANAALPKPDVLPKGVDVYQIGGPFFFGIADRLHDVLRVMQHMPRVFILRMKRVGSIDATAVNALESFVLSCSKSDCLVLLAEVSPHVRETLTRMRADRVVGIDNIYDDLQTALVRAEKEVISAPRQ